MDLFSEKDLGDALNGEQNTIEFEGDLAEKLLGLRRRGLWAIEIGAIGITFYSFMAAPATGGGAAVAAGITATAAVSVLGTSVTYPRYCDSCCCWWSSAFFKIVGALNKLRNYKIVEKSEDGIILKRQ